MKPTCSQRFSAVSSKRLNAHNKRSASRRHSPFPNPLLGWQTVGPNLDRVTFLGTVRLVKRRQTSQLRSYDDLACKQVVDVRPALRCVEQGDGGKEQVIIHQERAVIDLDEQVLARPVIVQQVAGDSRAKAARCESNRTETTPTRTVRRCMAGSSGQGPYCGKVHRADWLRTRSL